MTDYDVYISEQQNSKKMNANTLLITVNSFASTTGSKIENANKGLQELEKMLSLGNMPNRMIKKAIRQQRKLIDGMKDI